MKRVIGIGETVFDILFRHDQPLKAIPGGSTFNSIISLGRSGVECAMLTETGSDHIGDIICDYMRHNNVSTEYVCRHAGTKSHLSLAFLNEDNDANYIFYKDHQSLVLDGPLPQIGKSDVVLFGSFFAINPVLRQVVARVLRQAREVGAWLYYDVNFRKAHVNDIPQVMANIEENMQLSNVVRGSMEDFENLYGLCDADLIYQTVSRFCPVLILTNGSREIRVFTHDGCRAYPVRHITTVSTVGAGDNFNAGYIYAMLNGMDKEEDRIAMAQRWSMDVCQQPGNNISDVLVNQLKSITQP